MEDSNHSVTQLSVGLGIGQWPDKLVSVHLEPLVFCQFLRSCVLSHRLEVNITQVVNIL